MKKIFFSILIVILVCLIIIGILYFKNNNKEFSYIPITYEICDDDSCIYLLGSMHLGDDRITKIDDKIIDLYNKSEILAVEVDADISDIDITSLMLNGSIDEIISPELNEKLINFSYDHALFNYDTLKYMKLGYIYDYLSLLPYMEVGYMTEGVDSYLISLAHKNNKKIVSLETIDEQLNLLLGYSDSFYIRQIETVIDNYELAKSESMNLYELYINSNYDGLKNMIDLSSGLGIDEEENEFNKAMYQDRNILMKNKVIEFLDNNDSVFMAVGCAHVIGKDGIIELLKDNYKITRIE